MQLSQCATSFHGKCNLSKCRLKILERVLKCPKFTSDFQKDNSMELSIKLRYDVKEWHHFRNEICLHRNRNLSSKCNLWLTNNFTIFFFLLEDSSSSKLPTNHPKRVRPFLSLVFVAGERLPMWVYPNCAFYSPLPHFVINRMPQDTSWVLKWGGKSCKVK